MSRSNKLTANQIENLLLVLQARFERNMNRHSDIKWASVRLKLEKRPDKMMSLFLMEDTGGEPDVVGFDSSSNEYIFYDCSAESPKGRRSLCYDHEALEARKEHKPINSAIQMAKEMGIEILSEDQYKELQKLIKVDAKTSSWIKTPIDIRKLGGAIFSDFRYGHVFVYHNGAESYYAVRGFRGSLRV